MRRLFLVGTVAVAAAVLPGAAAATDYTWTGASGSPNWSAANWSSGAPSNGEAVGALSFTIAGAPLALRATNDLNGLTANALSVWEGGYTISGNAIGLGAGGLTAVPYTPPPGGRTPASSISLPLDLVADQTWSVPGAGYAARYDTQTSYDSSLDLSSVSGANTLGVDLGPLASLGLHTVEVGPLTLTGADASQTGAKAANNATVTAGELNAADGNPVTLKAVELDMTGTAPSTGPLSSSGATLEVGGSSPAVMTIHGDLTLDADSSLLLPTNGSISAGVDYSQVQVTGNATLGGALHAPGCSLNRPFRVGDSLTLLSAAGSLTGTFAGIPDGTIIPSACGFPGSLALAVHYTTHTVTGTVVPGWTVSVRGTPERPAKNQSVQIVAWVSISTPSPHGPAGTFDLPCGPRPVQVTSPTTGFATCQAVASNWGVPRTGLVGPGEYGLYAEFDPANEDPNPGAGYLESVIATDPDYSYEPGPTTTTLWASPATVPIGHGTTLTARVSAPSPIPNGVPGSVTFTDAGHQVPGCTTRPLADSLAVCSVPHPTRGTHHFRATYSGQGDYGPSGGTTTVEVEPGAVSVGHPQLSGSRLALPVRCSGAPCTVEVTLTSGRSTYARDTATIRPERAVYHLRLSSSAARSLARHHRLAATLRVTQIVGHATHALSRRSLTFHIARH